MSDETNFNLCFKKTTMSVLDSDSRYLLEIFKYNVKCLFCDSRTLNPPNKFRSTNTVPVPLLLRFSLFRTTPKREASWGGVGVVMDRRKDETRHSPLGVQGTVYVYWVWSTVGPSSCISDIETTLDQRLQVCTGPSTSLYYKRNWRNDPGPSWCVILFSQGPLSSRFYSVHIESLPKGFGNSLCENMYTQKEGNLSLLLIDVPSLKRHITCRPRWSQSFFTVVYYGDKGDRPVTSVDWHVSTPLFPLNRDSSLQTLISR